MYGTTGGLNPGKLTKDEEERLEPNRKRNPDVISDTIREYAVPNLGPHILHKTFHRAIPLTVGMDITFDRFYPRERLLVHSFSRRRLYSDTVDPAFESDLKRFEEFARNNDYHFLAIIDGDIDREDMNRLRVQLNPPKTSKKEKVEA